ncbi:MAG: hypothetical protein CMB99_07510 [Flavobacteriaceae bacterium]|nr:hypothetical protein [Flavobacteriaceae bacterium]|tara:strand:+ start:97133 stop:97906 length:774 start_codon:yes stop_codon:yes gene_type:complete
MIKFFRRIRKSLLEQDKMGKYFKYAIGEILLVVIGILIALQINNWNENRKDRIIEKKILSEVLLDLQINRGDLEDMIKIAEERLKKVEEINEHIIRRKPEYDSLGFELREASSTLQFTPRTIGNESLKAKGVDIIQNELVRNSIVRVYGYSFHNLIMEGREYEQFDNPTIDLLPYLKKHLVVDPTTTGDISAKNINYKFETYGLKIKDYKALLDDSEFLLMLQKSMFNRANKIIMSKRLIKEMIRVEGYISEELAKR